ncbi:MAG: ankyrin repeat domain-containing protein [Gammaproteobacteria bacterium]|nr:ankyrin repeat domain-containing protein [Gammaproteobacteria bacterium]
MDRVAQLLQEGHDPNARDQSGNTPLHYAAEDPWPNGPDAVRLLISAGARCDAQNNDGNTPLHVAAGTGDTDSSLAEAVGTVRLLLDCGANPNRRNNDGNTPLHTAFTGIPHFSLGFGDWGVVDALLRGGAKPNAKNNDGDTPLILAVQETDQYAKTVRVLLQHGANPDTRNRKGSAAVHLAAEETNPSVIAALLAGGADPDAKDKQGNAALHIVAKKRRERAKEIEALLVGGADPCVRDRKRNIPIYYAQEGSRANRLLYSAGGIDWDCDEKAVAEAPKQKPQQKASRHSTVVAQQEEPKREEPKRGKPKQGVRYASIAVDLFDDVDQRNHDVYWIAWGDSPESAQERAIRGCQHKSGDKCGFNTSITTTPQGMARAGATPYKWEPGYYVYQGGLVVSRHEDELACAAVASGDMGNGGDLQRNSAWGDSRAVAERKAVSHCETFWRNCRVLVSACDDGS